TEATGELLSDTYSRFMQSLNDDENGGIKAALLTLYDMVGDWNTKLLLDAFVDKRAEWWAARQQGEPIDWLQQRCGADGACDARLALWQDGGLVARIATVARLLGQGTKTNQKRATAIESALTAGASVDAFNQLCHEFFDADGDFRKNAKTNDLKQALEKHFGNDGIAGFDDEFVALGATLLQIQRRSGEIRVLALNAALFEVGTAYLEQYQAIKAEQRVFDFADLEWQAWRLLTDPACAAYLHSRLDARYRHILLDEFQDTNPLQWSIVQVWLQAYGDDAARPSVFIVGDPKQSIYRFRRAEPRVFAAARDLLKAQGAHLLRTNQTRRNAGAIIEVLNASLERNPIFSEQTTLADHTGAVWRLPLIQSGKPDGAAIATSALMLRDALTTPREEEEDARRLEEGRAIAQALLCARRELATPEEDVPWSDVMLLVRKRTHLSAYESALREAGIPFISNRRGGLLETLEIADLIALLTFLITPGDYRALAHVLKSPIIGASDDDLITLAQRAENGWWQRVQAAAREGASAPMRRAGTLLAQWLDCAPCLPVHDLLDRILHQGRLVERYAQAAPAMARSQVLGNIDAFVALALNLDAGRYPSLPKFIGALQALQRNAEQDAPDEANVDAAIDAVRILTIHSAKGLEAKIVALLDANHSDSPDDHLGILCEWPQDRQAPTHFSAFGRKAERGVARDGLFAEEERLKAQEDWNLLYVAATRAKELLIVGGVAGGKNAGPGGVTEDSWYARLQAAPEFCCGPAPDTADTHPEIPFELPVFDPPELAVAPAAPQSETVAAVEEGIALHALMERVTQSRGWPVAIPDTTVIAQWLQCSLSIAAIVRGHAQTILAQPQLERFYNPAHYRSAYNEMEIMVAGEVLRLDRVVIFQKEAWILDYKRSVPDSEYAAYQAQLRQYRIAVQAVFGDHTVQAALITVDGRFWQIE
ncbi:MAG TPA: UvrD-helicase domain-containing protein, partial [Burkholderiaceae bacterium]|nr:UvrD-helicase domain-containing protein [Burkholderiaceae bacterium]